MDPAHPEIEVAEARRRLAEYRLVDVRQPEEFEGPLGHIAGAELLPLAQLAARAGELRDGRPLLLICRSGNRSGKACQLLIEHGLPAPTNLLGGMIAWNRGGLPVERRGADSPRALADQLVAWLAGALAIEPGAARERVDASLRRLGADPDAPTARQLRTLLAELGSQLAAERAPVDTDLVLAAFGRDAEALDRTS